MFYKVFILFYFSKDSSRKFSFFNFEWFFKRKVTKSNIRKRVNLSINFVWICCALRGVLLIFKVKLFAYLGCFMNDEYLKIMEMTRRFIIEYFCWMRILYLKTS